MAVDFTIVKYNNKIPRFKTDTSDGCMAASERTAKAWIERARQDLANKAKHPYATGKLAESLQYKIHRIKDKVIIAVYSNKPYARTEEERVSGWSHSFLYSTRWHVSQSYGGYITAEIRKRWKQHEAR